MSAVRRFFLRLLSAVAPGRAESRLDREVNAHLLLLEDEYRRRGLSPNEARRAALMALGGIDQTKERHRDARAFRWLDDVRRDAMYAIRMLERYPVGTITSIVSLAIGIGLNAAVFSVVDWVLLRPLPYPAAHELVHVFTAGTSPVTGPSPLIYAEFEALETATSLRAAALFNTTTRVMGSPGVDPVHVVVARVAGDLFTTLGLSPAIGRTFSVAELKSGAPVVVLNHELWQRGFRAAANIVGRIVSIDGAPYTVVGVMPSGRGYPRDAELWRPLSASEHEDDDRELNMLARLRSGTDAESASAEMATRAQAISRGARTAWVEDLQRNDAGNVRAALQAVFAAAMLTLVIACANIAALIGARGADRAGEIAVRGALGATRARVLAQLITESLVLALAGGALGLLLGRWALDILVAMAPVDIPRLGDITLDGRIVGLGVIATLVTGVAVGLAPALALSRLTRTSAINRIGWHRTAPRSATRRALVLTQVAVTVVLATGAGLLARSLTNLVAIDHGFEPDRLVAMPLDLRGVFTGDARELFRELIAQAESIPGVEAAAWSMRLPTQIPGLRTNLAVVGESPLKAPATVRLVSAGYFDTVRLPVIAGRRFLTSDTNRSLRVAIVNTAFVRDLMNGRSPLERQLQTSIIDDPVTIVGVVGDLSPAGEADRPALYVPLEQLSTAGGYLIVRAQNDPRSIIGSLSTRLRTTAPTLAVDRVHRVAESLEESRAMVRFSTQLAAAFAGLALLLALIGVYGLTAGDVSARWRELGIRLALGASRHEALWTVLKPCASLLLAGSVVGMLGAVGVGPALASLLHGIDPIDAPTFIAAPLLLSAAGIVAAMMAARRIVRADPASILRSE